MQKRFFSIIIPTLNEEKYLPHLLGDLAKQTFRDFEVIVVDGKSEDQTVTKAEASRGKIPQLQIIASEKRHVCTQRNLGATQANADTLIFMDADDRLPPWFLQGIKYRSESESADILSPLIAPDPLFLPSKTLAVAFNLFLELQPKLLMEACVVIKKKCFTTVGGFDESVNYSEGSVFLAKARTLGYTYAIVKDPTYIFSFRRLKKYGSAKVISNAAGIQLMELLGIEQKQLDLSKLYPMLGGGVYQNKFTIRKNKIAKYLKNIAKILNDF